MENNKTERRINIIKEALKTESSGVLFAGMTDKQRAQLSSVFKVSEDEIVGYYEDIMNLGKTLLASVRGKFSNQGLLFLKDAFVYRKKAIDGITKVYYDDILLVEKGSFGTKVDYNFKGKTASIFLSGIAYSDSQKVIPDLLIRLKELSSAKVTSGQRVKKSEVKRETKREEKQDNIDKWNEHIRECVKKNRIAQIQHLDDYLQFPSFSLKNKIVMSKVVCNEYEMDGETKKSILINLYDKFGDRPKMTLPIDGLEMARVVFKIVPFFIEGWLGSINWNHGSNYDCDDTYNGKTYFFADNKEDYDSSIKTEEDVFIRKDEIQYLPDRALLYLADVVNIWRDENLSEVVGDYDLWKKKREFLLEYEDIVFTELDKRGLCERDNSEDDFYTENSSNQFANYGEQGEKDVEYALKWLPKEYIKIERSVAEGIRLFDPVVSDESQEIDHIVIGPNGVFLIETKYVKGNISIDSQGNWTRFVDGEVKGIRNPIQQTDRHHMLVKSILDGIVSDEDIHDIICLAYADSTIDGVDNSSIPVIRSDMLARFIVNCKNRKEYSEADIERILERIEKHRI